MLFKSFPLVVLSLLLNINLSYGASDPSHPGSDRFKKLVGLVEFDQSRQQASETLPQEPKPVARDAEGSSGAATEELEGFGSRDLMGPVDDTSSDRAAIMQILAWQILACAPQKDHSSFIEVDDRSSDRAAIIQILARVPLEDRSSFIEAVRDLMSAGIEEKNSSPA